MRILAVVADPADPALVAAELDRLSGTGDDVVVLASPSLTPMQWLTNEEDAARETAGEVAEESAKEAGEAVDAAPVAGDSDPVQAASDGLRRFDADQLVVLAPEGSEVDVDRLAALGVPLTVVELEPR